MIGTRLGHYRITEKIGAGGMGEVYRATDSRLSRDVAIKILPRAFAEAPERLVHFEREARLLASLNHPNIATLYGFEQGDDERFLVMELVPGETLAERIASGPLSLEELLALFRQIAEALEAAHERGVVHRDLKPSNVMITPEGQIKVLDFGLAKAFRAEVSGPELSRSPTFTRGATETGVILGTAAYMSPEQARGKSVDGRTDIWSFGCVLYEALTGRKAFWGETASDTIARILTQEPDWKALPERTPRSLRALLRRCLEKEAPRRLRHIDPVALEAAEEDAAARNVLRRAVPYLAAALAAGAAVWILKPSPSPPSRPSARLNLSLPPEERLAGPKPALAFSPDGGTLAYAAIREGSQQIYLRSLGELEARPVPGTGGGEQPFFSPDGEWLGFFADGKLKKVSLRGGPPITLSEASSPYGASWGQDGVIIFAPREVSHLSTVSADGGAPVVLTTFRSGDMEHAAPELLPGGRAVLFTVWGWSGSETVVQSLETGERRRLVPDGDGAAHYAPSGHLVYFRKGALMAAPFDPRRLELTGPSALIADGVDRWQFAVSKQGWLVYAEESAFFTRKTFVWVDRTGAERPLLAPAANYEGARISPDGRFLVTHILSDDGSPDHWLYDLEKEVSTRLTFEAWTGGSIEWSPDGKELAYGSRNGGPPQLYRMNVDRSGGSREIVKTDYPKGVQSWSPDGRSLVYFEAHPETDGDIWVLRLEGERTPHPFLQTKADEGGATFSPDGRFLAYVSNASGRAEVYVQAFPGPGGKWQISTDGGIEPMWARSGKELFYRTADTMMAVAIESGPPFAATGPRALFDDPYVRSGWFPASYDVSPDGESFLMLKADAELGETTQLHVVLDWAEGLSRR